MNNCLFTTFLSMKKCCKDTILFQILPNNIHRHIGHPAFLAVVRQGGADSCLGFEFFAEEFETFLPKIILQKYTFLPNDDQRTIFYPTKRLCIQLLTNALSLF